MLNALTRSFVPRKKTARTFSAPVLGHAYLGRPASFGRWALRAVLGPGYIRSALQAANLYIDERRLTNERQSLLPRKSNALIHAVGFPSSHVDEQDSGILGQDQSTCHPPACTESATEHSQG